MPEYSPKDRAAIAATVALARALQKADLIGMNDFIAELNAAIQALESAGEHGTAAALRVYAGSAQRAFGEPPKPVP